MQPWDRLEPFCKSIKINDDSQEIFYFDAGKDNDPVIFMVHGLGDEADTWRHVILPLAENYHVIALDLPGFGRSDKPTRKYTPEFLTDSIMAVINKLGIKKVILMGSSLGGILSQKLAVDFPEKITGLILVDGALLQVKPLQDWSLRLMQIPLLGKWLYTRLRKDPDAAYDSLRNVYADLDSMPKADRDFLYTRVNKRVWDDQQRHAYISVLQNLAGWVSDKQDELADQLMALTTPTLVIRGENDPLYPKENAIKLIEIQPEASMETVEGVGHLPHQEAPESFLSLVTQWLEMHY
mgnify:CR=1 FL=1